MLLVFKGLNLGIDFKGGTLIEISTNNTNISELRLTVDRIEDVKLIKEILNNIATSPIYLENVLELFSRKPELIKINNHINHNEGFNKSLKEDQEFIKKREKNH